MFGTLTVLRLNKPATQSGASVWPISPESEDFGSFCVVIGDRKAPSRNHTVQPNGVANLYGDGSPEGLLIARYRPGCTGRLVPEQQEEFCMSQKSGAECGESPQTRSPQHDDATEAIKLIARHFV